MTKSEYMKKLSYSQSQKAAERRFQSGDRLL